MLSYRLGTVNDGRCSYTYVACLSLIGDSEEGTLVSLDFIIDQEASDPVTLLFLVGCVLCHWTLACAFSCLIV